MTTPTAPSESGRFIGWALIVMGALMTLLCGGCTLVFIAVGIVGLGQHRDEAELPIVMALIFGALPTAAGVALTWAGWRIVKPRPPTASRVGETFE